jgi:hypothetical protein
MPSPDFRYRWAKLDQGAGWGVFVAYDQGQFAGWWRLVAEFQLEIRASDYAECENHLLGMDDEDPFRRDDDAAPENLPGVPPSGITIERLETEIAETIEAVEADQGQPIDVPQEDTRSAHDRAEEWARDLTGQRFGSLTVKRRSERTGEDRHRYWICRCDCANQKVARSDHLLSGQVTSCGCARAASSAFRSTFRGKGGKFKSPKPEGAREAEVDAIERFIAEHGVTKGEPPIPPDTSTSAESALPIAGWRE